MAALTADRNTRYRAQGTIRMRRNGVAAATRVFKGGIACKNAAGWLVPGSDTAGLVVVGIFEETVDNSGGGNGALQATYASGVEAERDNAGGAGVQATQTAAIADDQSVTTAAVAANDIPVGQVIEFTATKVWVEIGSDK